MLDVVDCPDNPHPISFSERKTMTVQVKSIPELKEKHANCSSEVRKFFKHISDILDKKLPLEVCLAYAFFRLERGQNMAIYCGAVKLHNVAPDLAKDAIEVHRMGRKDFCKIYYQVFNLEIPQNAFGGLHTAQQTRNAIMHGKKASPADIRNSIAFVLEYAEEVNRQLKKECGLKPFSDLRGFSGGAQKLDTETSRRILKNMGLNLS